MTSACWAFWDLCRLPIFLVKRRSTVLGNAGRSWEHKYLQGSHNPLCVGWNSVKSAETCHDHSFSHPFIQQTSVGRLHASWLSEYSNGQGKACMVPVLMLPTLEWERQPNTCPPKASPIKIYIYMEPRCCSTVNVRLNWLPLDNTFLRWYMTKSG